MAATSSPLSSLPPSQAQTKQFSSNVAPPQYHPAAQLPFELAQHALTYFEEGLFTHAFQFLTSIIFSGAAATTLTMPAMIPSPVLLAITATIAVHPTFTTRTTSKEKWDQANGALRLLRVTNQVVGPVNANFATAFEFKRYTYKASRHGSLRDADADLDHEAQTRIDSPYAEVESIWMRAEDFWHIVGWTFNCSCLDLMHASRWSHWSLWLEFIIRVLEDDWQLRYSEANCDESLIFQFIDNTASGHGRDRRIIRSIFADGTARSMNEFKEIFKNELKEPKQDSDKIKKREVERLNIDEEVYGDYMAPDNDDSDEDYSQSKTPNPAKRQRTRTPSNRRVTPRTSNHSLRSDGDSPVSAAITTPNGVLLGGPKSLNLRLRLLHLLSHVSGAVCQYGYSFLELDELYTLFVEFIKPLPLSTFQAIVASNVLSADAHSTLCEFLLQRMLETSAPAVSAKEERYLTRKSLVEDYLPFAASRSDVVSNAKVSILLEILVRSMTLGGHLKGGQDLKDALRAGIEKRERAGKGGRRNGNGNGDVTETDEEAWSWLVESGKRMLLVAEQLG